MTDTFDDAPLSIPQRAVRNVFGLDARSLAVFRFVIGLLLLIDLYDRSLYMTDFYTDEGFLTRQVVADYLAQMHPPNQAPAADSMPWPFWSIHLLNGELWFAQTLFVAQAICIVVLMFGWKTRLFTFLTWLLLISLHVRNPVVLNSGDTLVRMMLLWGIFLPLGARWSIDRLMVKEPKFESNRHVSIASAAFIIQLGVMYFFTGLAKYNDVWMQGQAINNVLNLSMVSRPLGKYLLEYPELTEAMCQVTLWLEIGAPFLLLFPWKTAWIRVALIATFLAFHLGIALTMTVGLFSAISMACWVALIPTEFWNARWVRNLSAGIMGSPTMVDEMEDEETRLVGVPDGGWTRIVFWSAQVVCGLLLVYVILWNVWRVSPNDPKHSQLMPQALRPLGQATMVAQEFKMFDTPPALDYWFMYEAQLKNGEQVELFTGKPLEPNSKPNDLYSRYRDHRWRRLHVNFLHPDFEVLREPLTQYLVDKWNNEHADEHQVTRCLFRCYTEDTAPNADPGNLSVTNWVDIKDDADPLESLLQSLEQGGSILP